MTGACEAAADAACSDGAQNGDETGVDCGGPACARCGLGGGCAADNDCQTGACSAGVCVESASDHGSTGEFLWGYLDSEFYANSFAHHMINGNHSDMAASYLNPYPIMEDEFCETVGINATTGELDCGTIDYDSLLLGGCWCHTCLPVNPCRNGGTCVNYQNQGYTCDCADTGFHGDHCHLAAAELVPSPVPRPMPSPSPDLVPSAEQQHPSSPTSPSPSPSPDPSAIPDGDVLVSPPPPSPPLPSSPPPSPLLPSPPLPSPPSSPVRTPSASSHVILSYPLLTLCSPVGLVCTCVAGHAAVHAGSPALRGYAVAAVAAAAHAAHAVDAAAVACSVAAPAVAGAGVAAGLAAALDRDRRAHHDGERQRERLRRHLRP